MRTITARFTIPEEDEADYADVIGELVLADYMAYSSVGFELVSDSAPPAGTEFAVDLFKVCECASPNFKAERIEVVHCWNCGLPPSGQVNSMESK